jgi:MSHA biogenesis protein MshK
MAAGMSPMLARPAGPRCVVLRRAGPAGVQARWAIAPVALLLLVVAPAHAAQALPDPTRPPDAVLAPVQATAGQAGPVLQSVLIAGERRSALIDGVLVPVGGVVGGARVVRIAETEVVLRRGDLTETLKLFPAVDKRLHEASPAAVVRTPGGTAVRAGETR